MADLFLYSHESPPALALAPAPAPVPVTGLIVKVDSSGGQSATVPIVLGNVSLLLANCAYFPTRIYFVVKLIALSVHYSQCALIPPSSSSFQHKRKVYRNGRKLSHRYCSTWTPNCAYHQQHHHNLAFPSLAFLMHMSNCLTDSLRRTSKLICSAGRPLHRRN